MPSLAEHAHKVAHNEAFFRGFDLDTTPYLDWVVVVVFYSALHPVEAFAATRGEHFETHLEREQFVWASPELRPVYTHYRRLYDDSLDARYEIRTFTPDEVRGLITNHFEPLKQHISSLPVIP